MKPRSSGVSIAAVVCTYNRASDLPYALESLADQTLSKSEYRVIVVDNSSTDTTQEVLASYRPLFPNDQLLVLVERKRGLGHARNAATEAADAEYLAFMDDDAIASKSWLEMALLTIQHVEQSCGIRPLCLGGPILPWYRDTRPQWFKDDYEIRSWGPKARRLRVREVFCGSNMIWRRDFLRDIGGFAVDLGMKGELMSFGEESAVFHKAWESATHPAFWYTPELTVQHLVPPWKFSPFYHARRQFAQGLACQHVVRDAMGRGRLTATALGVWTIARGFVRMLVQPLLRRHWRWQHWIVEDCPQFLRGVGMLCGALGLQVRIRAR